MLTSTRYLSGSLPPMFNVQNNNNFPTNSQAYNIRALSMWSDLFCIKTSYSTKTFGQQKAINKIVGLARKHRWLLDLSACKIKFSSLAALLPAIDLITILTRHPRLILVDLKNARKGYALLLKSLSSPCPPPPPSSKLTKSLTSLVILFPKSLSQPDEFDFDYLKMKINDISELLGTDDNLTSLIFAPSLLKQNTALLQRNKHLLINLNSLSTNISFQTNPNSQTLLNSVLRKNPRLLVQDPNLTLSRRKALTLALPGLDVPKMIHRVPRLLTTNIESSAPLILDSLRRCLPPNVDVDLLIRRSPSLLTFPYKYQNLDVQISKRLVTLASILASEDRLALRAIEQHTNGVPLDELDTKFIKNRGKIAASNILRVITTNPNLLYSVGGKGVGNPQAKLKQLEKVLSVSTVVAKRIAVRSPTILSMDILKFRAKIRHYSEIFDCNLSSVSRLVSRAPTLLTMKPGTVEVKMIQLEALLSGTQEIDGNDNTIGRWDDNYWEEVEEEVKRRRKKNRANISKSTLAIARRCPLLLCSDIKNTLAIRSVSLRYLLMGGSVGRTLDQKEALAFQKLLKRAPELLLSNTENRVAPKLKELSELIPYFGINDDNDNLGIEPIGSSEVGARLALKEPRLLNWDISTLKLKLDLWRRRVFEPAVLDAVIAKYPTLLMYSFGACGRLDYFKEKNGEYCDGIEARQLIMFTKNRLEFWGHDKDATGITLPGILGGGQSVALGRRRVGEGRVAAMDRQVMREQNNARVFRFSYKEFLVEKLCLGVSKEAMKTMVAELTVAELEKCYGNVLKAGGLGERNKMNAEEELVGKKENFISDALGIALVDRARKDEKRLRYEFVDNVLGTKMTELLPTLNFRPLVETHPMVVSAVVMNFEDVKERVVNLRRLLKGVDVGAICGMEPTILDPGVESFNAVSNRFANLLDLLSFGDGGRGCGYNEVARMVAKDPRLLLSNFSDDRVVAKIKWMLEAVGREQGEQLKRLLLAKPELLFVATVGSFCRLEYLRDCGGGYDENDKNDELCSVEGGIPPPLLVGQIPAVVLRGEDVMCSRHPYYDLYVKEKVKLEMGREGEERMRSSLAELEEIWGTRLLEAVI